jgi:serine/threonine-protein kinase
VGFPDVLQAEARSRRVERTRVIGTTLDGKYHIKKVLGAGAMGQVFAAEHAATGRKVAVKVISSPELIRDATVVSRFQREARVAGGIDTQHITQVLDAGVDSTSGLPFLVMEYLTGEDLSQLIKRLGPLAPELALRIIAQSCLGLQKAHEANVVHRDMKPANLFLAKRDAGEIIVKLLDFGIAKVKMDAAHDAENAELTRTGSMLGSPLYMSPEQARGDVKAIDHRTDLWSLGIVFYQALAGRTPYQHITALGQLILAICSEWPQHIQEVAPWVPPDVAAVVHRCLQHNPAERYQSAAEMFKAVKALLPAGSWTINEDMVMSLQDTARSQVASKFALTSALSNAQTAVVSGPNSGPQSGSVTTDAVMQSQAAPPAGNGKLALGVSAVMLVGAGVVGTYFATRPHPQTEAHTQATTATATATATAPPPVPSATAAVATAAPDLTPRRVKVVIMPADASIEIEGEPAMAKGGLLEIAGTLGSVRRVRIFKGKNEVTTDVIVTEAGPSPPKIELTFGGPKPSATASAAAAAPKAPSGIVDDFK